MRAEQWILEFQAWLRIPSISLVLAAMTTAIVDAGPLVAFLDRAEQNHPWVVARIEELDPPLLVCEPVLAEAMHLLARFSGAQNALFGLLENGALRIAFSIDEQVPALRKLHQNYWAKPMSLLDS